MRQLHILHFLVHVACRRHPRRLARPNPPKSPDVADSIRKSLDQAGLKDVKVSQDRVKGVVTLDGDVPSEMDKSQAETIAKSHRSRPGGSGPNRRRPSSG